MSKDFSDISISFKLTLVRWTLCSMKWQRGSAEKREGAGALLFDCTQRVSGSAVLHVVRNRFMPYALSGLLLEPCMRATPFADFAEILRSNASSVSPSLRFLSDGWTFLPQRSTGLRQVTAHAPCRLLAIGGERSSWTLIEQFLDYLFF